MVERGVTVKHLNDEPMDGRGRCQKTLAPTMTGLTADFVNRLLIEMTCEVLPKLSDRGNNPLMHPRASYPMVCVTAP